MMTAEIGASPTRFRWTMLGMLLAISMVTYIDRVNVSIAASYIRHEYGLGAVAMGKIFSAFVLGYAALQIPFGLLGDRLGPRRLLTFAIVWWSIFTVITAHAGGMFTASVFGVAGSFFLVRLLIGAGEAAAFPNFNRIIAFWMAPGDRAFAGSLVLGASGLGAAITPPVIAWIIVNYGWRASFYVSGAIGLVLAFIWWSQSTDRPAQHSRVNALERQVIQGAEMSSGAAIASAGTDRLSFMDLLRDRNVQVLILSNGLFGYVAYVYLSWFYPYLVEVRGFSVLASSWYGTLPFIAITVLTPVGGLLSDRIARSHGKRRGRRTVVVIGMTLTSLFVAIGGSVANPYVAIAMLSLGAGFLYFSISPYWATIIDVAKSSTGLASGMMNTGGHIGGALSPTLTPLLAEAFGWPTALGVAAGAALLGGLVWFLIDADRPVQRRPRGADLAGN